MNPVPTIPSDRLPLTRERVLDAAVAFADEHGVGALSMRKLAAELGFEVMSLYNHVSNKQDMFQGMIDRVAGEIEHGDGHWRDAISSMAHSAHIVLRRHPWVPPIWNDHFPGPNRFGHLEWILRTFSEGGFPDDLVYHAYHAVEFHIMGFAIQEQQYAQSGMGDDMGEAEIFEMLGKTLPEADYPHLWTHVRQHMDGDERDEFAFVLDLLLDGLERLRDVG